MRPLSFFEAFSLRRTIEHGVLAVRVAPGPMWFGGLLMMIGDGCNPGNLGDLLPSDDDKKDALLVLPRAGHALLAAAAQGGFELPSDLGGFIVGAVLAVVLFALLAALAMFALGCWITTGFVRMHVGILEREDDSLEPLFSGRDRFWAMVGYKSFAGLAVSAAFLVSIWPGALVAGYGYVIDSEDWMLGGAGLSALLVIPVMTYVALGTFLGEHAVALDGMDATHALRRSWQLAAGNRWPMLLFVLVCGLLQLASLVGLLLCCIGALATMPLARALVGFAKTEGYLLFTRGREGTSSWKLWQREANAPVAPPVPPAAPVPPA